MNIFAELRVIATKLNEESEFPSWLMTNILAIADKPECYSDKIHLVELLISQIGNFDVYAGVGCFDTSVSAETIGITIRQIVTNT